MKQPNYLDYCSDGIEELYAKLQDHLLKKVVKRILDFGEISGSSKYELEMLEQSGMIYDEIVQDVAAFLHTSDSMVQELFAEAQVENLAFDNSVIEVTGQRPILETASPEVNQIVKAAISKTNGNLHNLTMTTAGATQQKFIEACSLAEMEISTGAFDVNTAIRHAIEHAIQDGVCVYYYNDETDDTKVTAKRNIVSAVRTAVLTGVSQTTGEISLKNAEKLGTDIMELSAHIGARPSHSIWQGRLVCISDRETEYLTLEDIGYGEPDGFKGINCRHYWFAFVEGVSERTYTDEELEEMNNATVSYNGVEMSVAEANSRQRAMERKIRAERSQLVALDNAIKEALNSGNDEVATDLQINFNNVAITMKRHEAIYKDFCQETGLPVLSERLQYPSFNRSISQKAVQVEKQYEKMLQKSENDVILDMNRTTINKGVFSFLPERMSKKHIRSVAKQYSIDLKGITVSIDKNEELLKFQIAGRADTFEIGKITFLPNAFKSREELVRTIFHEKQHVLQFKEFGAEYVQNNRAYFEKITYQLETQFVEELKKKGLL